MTCLTFLPLVKGKEEMACLTSLPLVKGKEEMTCLTSLPLVKGREERSIQHSYSIQQTHFTIPAFYSSESKYYSKQQARLHPHQQKQLPKGLYNRKFQVP